MTVGRLLETLASLSPDMDVLVPGYEMHWDILDFVLIGRSSKNQAAKEYEGEYEVTDEGALRVMLCSRRHRPYGGEPYESEMNP